MSRELEILSRCLHELRRSEQHGPHSKAVIRDVYIKALILLCEDLLLRTLAREAESPTALVKAIERQYEKSEEELKEPGKDGESKNAPWQPKQVARPTRRSEGPSPPE